MPPITLQQAFELAIQHHQAGRLREAETLYRKVLEQHPSHVDALHLLGVIAQQVGQYDVAVDLIGRAIALKPNFAEAYNNLGIALKEKGDLDASIAAFGQAISLKPNNPNAHNNFGNALKDKGQLNDAIAAYRKAISLRPDYPEAHNNLGTALKDSGQLHAAITAYRQAISLKNDLPEAHSNLGIALKDSHQLDEAITAFGQAIALKPNFPEFHNNLGNALKDKGQLDAAIASYLHAISLKPNFHEAHSNLGNAFQDLGQMDQAIASYRTAIELKPDYAEAHFNFARALLLQGNFAQGWQEFERRLKMKDFPLLHRNLIQPQWKGEDLAGGAILLYAEQGLGDTLQFMRYLPLVAKRGGRMVVECPQELTGLLQQNARGWQVIVSGELLPDFDVHCSLLSLPLAFKTTLENIPQAPYLQANAERTKIWQDRLAGDSRSIKIGLAWAGGKLHKNDRNRSIALTALAPLARTKGIHFYSLQKGEEGQQAKHPPPGMDLTDWTQELNDLADTAALIANLDLIISVDTAVAHLAGAMGKPVWVLLPFAPDWRWMLGREDSPWYPTMRLFRQTRIGDWREVLERVSDALAKLA